MTEKEAEELYLKACENYRKAQRLADNAHQELLLAYETWVATDDD